mmetsp:Transcript_34708/g.51557  ORF Transcript_34708/g.51557 Transcript_34708/m.51557 type:complete len:124 (-) Transcript_34708:552-923(-)
MKSRKNIRLFSVGMAIHCIVLRPLIETHSLAPMKHKSHHSFLPAAPQPTATTSLSQIMMPSTTTSTMFLGNQIKNKTIGQNQQGQNGFQEQFVFQQFASHRLQNHRCLFNRFLCTGHGITCNL